jgi:hypothetical protein
MDDMSVKRFIKDLRELCKRAGVTLELRPSQRVRLNVGNVLVAGYFEAGKSLVVAKKSLSWLATLVHESCHMDQWLEQSELWEKDEQYGNDVIQEWLDGKEVKNINKAITNIINLELDCERRALKKIMEYDLPVNTATYIQRANDNVLHYRWIQKTRCWNNNLKDIYLKMPTRFMSDSYYKTLSPRIERIFLEAA